MDAFCASFHLGLVGAVSLQPSARQLGMTHSSSVHILGDVAVKQS